MDAHALLSAQGWRGTGHSLHKTDDSIGLAKPLLLNRKTNTKGLGNTKHFTSDLWWMDAFDEQLKGLDTSKEGKVEQTVTTGKLNALDPGRNSKYSIYATFVRGGFLQGTLDSLETTDESTSAESEKSAKKETASSKATKSTKPKKESKEEKRARKEEKRKRKEARALRRAAKAERRLRRSEARKDASDSSSSTTEEKRLRRARKEEKRRRKELEKKKALGG
ncbi:hypothetical protein J3F83DRAFT_726589 [Trichoderma novae-zelandiae]